MRSNVQRAFPIAALLLAAALVCPKANAKQTWLEIHTPHFLVITDGSARQAIRIANHFESIRDVFLKIWRMHVDPPSPVIILAAKNGEDLGRLLPGYWKQKGRAHPSGIFVYGPGENFVALRMDVNGETNYHIVYHEYVHLLERLNFPKLPVWLSEGFAEFYGSAQIGKKIVSLGFPIRGDIYLLRQGKWIPLDKVLTASTSSPFYNENDLVSGFYAESWELTHYLLLAHNGALRPELDRYITLYQQGVASLTAAQEAFGNLHSLANDLHLYARHLSFHFLQVRASTLANEGHLLSRPLSPAETDAVFGEFYADTGETAAAQTSLNRAVHLDPKLPGPYASLSFLALRRNDKQAALQWLDKAVASGSKNYLVYYYRGILLVDGAGRSALPQAESDLNKSIDLNSSFSAGYSNLAEMYADSGSKLDVASGLAHRAIELDPSSSKGHLALGMVLLRQGEKAAAVTEARKAVNLAHSSGDRQRAERFLREAQPFGSLSPPDTAGATAPIARSGNPSATGSPSGTAGTVAPAAGPRAGTPNPPGVLIATITAEGKVLRAKCSGKQLTFLLMVNGSGVPLFAPDAGAVALGGFSGSGAKRPACLRIDSQIGGREVGVKFKPTHGKPYSGEILEIDLEKGQARKRPGS